MDVIIDIIFDLILEGALEGLFVLIGKVFFKAKTDEKALKVTKVVIYSFLAICLLTLLIISLCYKKGVLIILSLSYLVFLLLAYYLMFVFRVVLDKPKGETIIRWIVRIIKYPFVLSLFILGIIYLEDETAKILLITGSILGIIIYLFIDAFRVYRHNHKDDINYIHPFGNREKNKKIRD